LLDAASGNRFEVLYMVAIHTGLRRGELLGLRWTDADLDAGTLTVRRSLDVDGTFKAPKNRAARRTLKLTPRALETLKAHKARQNAERLRAGSRWQDHGLVFPNTVGKPMNAGNLCRREFQPLLERAGLRDEGFTIHSLRHRKRDAYICLPNSSIGLLSPSAILRRRIGVQPQRDVGGLHHLPHHPYRLVIQRLQIRLNSQLGLEGF
jgi:integrase